MDKTAIKKKLENFWYHNKFAIIVVPIFAIFVIVSTVQLLTKKHPDANFLYMGPAPVAFYGQNLLQESIATVMKDDYNNDGEKTIDYIEPGTDGDFATGYTTMQAQKNVGESFAAHIIAGDSMIFLLDETYFNAAKETGVLMPLSEALGYTPEFAINEYAVYLSDLDVYYLPGFNLFPRNTLLCIRYPVTLTSGKTEVENREKWNMSVFRDMFSYSHPEKPTETPVEPPVSLTAEEFKSLLSQYSDMKGFSISEEEINSSVEISTEDFFAATGANVYKANGVTYLVYYKKIYVLGKHIDGEGVIDLVPCDFDKDGTNDVLFTYTYGKNGNTVCGASVFNIKKAKETFLSVDYESPMVIRQNGEKFELYSFEQASNGTNTLKKHIFDVYSNDAQNITVVKKDV